MKRTLTVSLTPVLLTACAHSGQTSTAPPAATLVATLISEQVPKIQQAQTELTHTSTIRTQTKSPASASPVILPKTPQSEHMLMKPAASLVGAGKTSGTQSNGSVTNVRLPGTEALAISGQAESLRQAVTRIAPAGWQQRYVPPLMADKREPLRWNGGEAWSKTLTDLLRPLGDEVQIDTATRLITLSPAKPGSLIHASQPLPVPGLLPFKAVPAKTPPPAWQISAGSMLKDALFTWAATARCDTPGIENWTVDWSTSVTYRVDAPLTFTGSFRDALNGLFTLYGTAKVPLYAAVRTKQCVVTVDDKEP